MSLMSHGRWSNRRGNDPPDHLILQDPGPEDLTLSNNDVARVREREAVVRPLPSEFGSGSSVFASKRK